MEHHKWGNTSKKRMEGVNPILIEFANRLLHDSPLDLSIPWRGGLRTAEQQREIYDRGASKCDGTHKKSYHQSGNAIDICIYSKTIEGMYDRDRLEVIGDIGLLVWSEMEYDGVTDGYELTWGGNFRSFYDPVHWEIKKRN